MAIQLDLSTMYSQLENVAKFNASQNQAAQVANQLGISRATQDSLQKSKTVQEAAQNEVSSMSVRPDGRQGGGSAAPEQPPDRERKDGGQDAPAHGQWEFTDPLLGRHIDITR